MISVQWMQWMRECFAKSAQGPGLGGPGANRPGKLRSSCEALRTFAYRHDSTLAGGREAQRSSRPYNGVG